VVPFISGEVWFKHECENDLLIKANALICVSSPVTAMRIFQSPRCVVFNSFQLMFCPVHVCMLRESVAQILNARQEICSIIRYRPVFAAIVAIKCSTRC
jgi:hypothetical protein